MKWRKEYGTNNIRAEDLPTEVFKSGLLKQGTLPDGTIVWLITVSKYARVNEWSIIVVHCVLWAYEQLEPTLIDGQKVIAIYDLSNCAMSQLDHEFVSKLGYFFLKYYPGAVYRILLYQVPWVLKPFVNGFLSMIPVRSIKKSFYVVDKKSILSYLDSDSIPDALSGPVKMDFIKVPDSMSNIESIGSRLGFKRCNIDKFKRVLST